MSDRTRPVMTTTLSTLIAAVVLLSVPARPLAAAQQQSGQRDPETRARAQRDGPGSRAVKAGTGESGRQFAPLDLAPGSYQPTETAAQRLDPHLRQLAAMRSLRGDAAAALFARQHGYDWKQGAVLVMIDAGLQRRGLRLRDASSRAIVDEVLVELDARGARLRNVFGPHIEAWVPVARLTDLESLPTIRSVRRPWRMRADVTSEGRAVIGADRWDGVMFRGPVDGLRVGVIDLTFKGYEDLEGRELPAADKLFTRSFRDDGDIEGDDEHGAAVAEIIYDIEPSASLYLAAVETIGDINEAIDYMIQNGVDVINMSLGCVGCGPGDGRGDAVEIVERAPQAGIPFVTSAGNDADRHWIGDFVDSDGDGFHEFAPGDESNTFPGDGGDEVDIVMNWDFANWFASSQDFDLLLLDSAGNVVDQSRLRQAGFAGQEAVEEITLTLPFSDTFHIVVQRVQATLPQTIEIFVDVSGLQHVVAMQSLSLPADGRQIIAVGAVNWSSRAPEGFSSRGPTKDGRLKPDLGAPDGVSTQSFGPLSFFGTSAASPHVVGAVALLRGRLGLLSGADAYSLLPPRLIDLLPSGPDNVTGGGLLSLLPPS